MEYPFRIKISRMVFPTGTYFITKSFNPYKKYHLQYIWGRGVVVEKGKRCSCKYVAEEQQEISC
jgi:hypothetical protein